MDLLPALQTYLAAQGIARDPDVEGTAPPLFLHPDAIPAPGEGVDETEDDPGAVLAAFISPGVPPRPYESFLRLDGVQLWLRVKDPATAVSIEAAIRAAVVDKRDWQMAGLHVIESSLYSDLTPLGYDTAAQAFDFTANYLFNVKGNLNAPE